MGGLVLFVELHCPEPELERGIEQPERSRFEKLTSKARYRALRDSGTFQSPAMPTPSLTIDTGSHSPADSARRIQQALDAT